jgi:hypothetical protein
VRLGAVDDWSVLGAAGLLALAAGAAAVIVRSRRTEVSGHGFRTRSGPMPWHLVSAVEETRLGPARWLRLILWNGRKVLLPGPVSLTGGDPGFAAAVAAVRDACPEPVRFTRRDPRHAKIAAGVLVAVLAVTLYQDRPWHRAFWPGVVIATMTPDPCAAATEVAQRLVPGSRGAGRSLSAHLRTCSFTDERRAQWLVVQVTREPPHDGDDAPTRAAASYDSDRRIVADEGTDTPGVTDEATVEIAESGSGMVTGTAVARRVNVVIQVRYTRWTGTATDGRAALVDVTRAVAAAVRLD